MDLSTQCTLESWPRLCVITGWPQSPYRERSGDINFDGFLGSNWFLIGGHAGQQDYHAPVYMLLHNSLEEDLVLTPSLQSFKLALKSSST